ncbi:hypothetical protein GWI33_008168 [Rhynchophorus ferrugineus]|uniref:Uncharacterized protein n=1 Tax=Rhynchophorus ferrugineus TaxID=354439 RepID=A0A834MG27_RHYFE|nr:hypothetical protein GWI33_008168 [Rhynchophorus ferrugineus]
MHIFFINSPNRNIRNISQFSELSCFVVQNSWASRRNKKSYNLPVYRARDWLPEKQRQLTGIEVVSYAVCYSFFGSKINILLDQIIALLFIGTRRLCQLSTIRKPPMPGGIA